MIVLDRDEILSAIYFSSLNLLLASSFAFENLSVLFFLHRKCLFSLNALKSIFNNLQFHCSYCLVSRCLFLFSNSVGIPSTFLDSELVSVSVLKNSQPLSLWLLPFLLFSLFLTNSE